MKLLAEKIDSVHLFLFLAQLLGFHETLMAPVQWFLMLLSLTCLNILRKQKSTHKSYEEEKKL